MTSETKYIHPSEIVGSVKTTSKDRIDKIFLDKYLLSKLLGRNVPVIAVFLHDVQRARKGISIFGINSTFKSNHFLGYTVALNKLDGVYYVDPRPEMTSGVVSGLEFTITHGVFVSFSDAPRVLRAGSRVGVQRLPCGCPIIISGPAFRSRAADT